MSAASEGADAPVSWQMPGVRWRYPVERGNLFVGTYKMLCGDKYLEESLQIDSEQLDGAKVHLPKGFW